jgi:hypothetical protein
MRLGRIIRGPILRVGRLVDDFGHRNRLSHGHAAVVVLLAFHREFDGEEMLTLQSLRIS